MASSDVHALLLQKLKGSKLKTKTYASSYYVRYIVVSLCGHLTLKIRIVLLCNTQWITEVWQTF